MGEQIREWFPVILSLGAIVGGYYTLRAKVDEITQKFSDFLNKEYMEFKSKQDKYIQEHYARIASLEIKAAAWEAAQKEINSQTTKQFEEIKTDLKDIKGMLSKRHSN